MSAAPNAAWPKEFGIEGREPPAFYTSPAQIDAAGSAAPQPHALRRAFEQLGIHGVLCQEKTPVIYFRNVQRVDPQQVLDLHRLFWNQGVAPILALIAPDQAHIYSGLTAPASRESGTQSAGLVQTLDRVGDNLRAFILAVESGEYFNTHRRSFDPLQRVDRQLLRNLMAAREQLAKVPSSDLSPHVLDGLLCRLVFTCYLFDRGVIDSDYLTSHGITAAKHLRAILNRRPRTDASADLYKLFGQLATDFNGDLFSADLEAESKQVKAEHLDTLDRFFSAADVRSAQQSLWPYDFSIIPIETISAIYEHFLKAAGEKKKREAGAFYTPRHLAELVLDVALAGTTTLLNKRFLDPACGSGIFLVGLFNRLAEEWKQTNPGARYDRRANGLMQILRENLFGVDCNPTACQITAFSLYLAFLDQLSPPDIRELQRKGKVLPPLVHIPGGSQPQAEASVIRCADFFTPDAAPQAKAHFVIGNPPWASAKGQHSPAARWCADRTLPFPDRQLATAFIWKAPYHLEAGGRVCFVLPHGTLFNHSQTALAFQQTWFRTHAVDSILNLADYQRFLFEESEAPAIVVCYQKEKPGDSAHRIDYWSPKTDWAVTQAEVISVLPQDRHHLTVREVLTDLKEDDAPLIWKERFWATPRDWRLLDRLSLMPRLSDVVGQPSRHEGKRWLIAEGFQPHGQNDPPSSKKQLPVPTTAFIRASHPRLNLFLLPKDCDALPSRQVQVRRLIRNTDIFRAPHVLVTQGYSRIAFADFDVCFRHAVRGIHGPSEDRDLFMFLAAYLRSALARFFLFHTSSNWGVSRAKVHVEELLRLPFPLPEQGQDPSRCRTIVGDVAKAVAAALEQAKDDYTDRPGIVRRTQAAVEKLIEEYFDIDDIERMLIADTIAVVIPSVRPTRARPDVPSIRHANAARRAAYTKLLTEMLNGWAKKDYQVHAKTTADASIGVGMVVLEKTRRGESPSQLDGTDGSVLRAIDHLQRTTAKKHGSFELARGLKVFDKNLLYITKPLGQRFWTNTAALNDADEIAATILMRPAWEEA